VYAKAKSEDGDGDGAGGGGLLGALSKLNPFKGKKEKEGTSLERRGTPTGTPKGELLSKEMSEQIFGKGLMGKLATKAVNSAAKALGEQLSAAQEGVEIVYEESTRAVKLDGGLISALGGGTIECGPVMSQSSSSSNINGQKTTYVSIGYQVRGARGSAFVRAQYDGARTTTSAQLADGRVLPVGGISSAQAGTRDARGGSPGNTYDEIYDINPDDVIDV
jgi:hypothetical protein